MEVQIFNPLTLNTPSFQANKLGVITQVAQFSLSEKFRAPGNFQMEIPLLTRFLDKIAPQTLLCVDKTHWLRVLNTFRDDQKGTCTISGTDLKGFLSDRITLYGEIAQDTGTAGYDVALGSTETILKHYITVNMASPADPRRCLFGLEIAQDMGRGLQNDRYMSRFEELDRLAEKVCKNGKLGYTLHPDISRNALVFDVLEPVNRTAGQSERERIIFSVDRKNIATLTYSTASEHMRNVFYATKSGAGLDSEAVTQIVTREGENTETGAFRREMHLNVSCDSIAEIERYARQNMEDYQLSHEIEAQTTRIDEYNRRYFLGDYVTIKMKSLKTVAAPGGGLVSEIGEIILDTQITEVHRVFTKNSHTLTITFGEKAPKILNKLEQKINNNKI